MSAGPVRGAAPPGCWQDVRREAGGVVTQPFFRVERGSAECFEIGVKAMEAAQVLEARPGMVPGAGMRTAAGTGRAQG